MGIDPAPFWGNLFLYTYEHDYIKKLIKEDRVKAKHFHSTWRFIDDLCIVNDGEMFKRVFQDIYPDELELKVEHDGDSGTFLNLDIWVEEGQFVYKLYDKGMPFLSPLFVCRTYVAIFLGKSFTLLLLENF